MTQPTPPIRAPFTNPCYGAGSVVIDKTGTVFQVWTGRLTNPGPWGPHIYRTAPGGKPELVWFIENANGTQLMIMNKQLWFAYTPQNGGQWLQQIDGYIDPSDTPSSKIVDVDETQVATLKQSIATAQAMASQANAKALQAQTTASAANNTAAAALAKVTEQTKQIQALQAQVNALLTPAQVNDLVWSKVWDANYQIRMGLLAGRSAIQQVQDYLNDLAVYIRNVTGK
jgi:hypothetical protein